jgi:hypothetical protein
LKSACSDTSTVGAMSLNRNIILMIIWLWKVHIQFSMSIFTPHISSWETITRLSGYHSGAVDVTLQYDVYFPSSLHWDTHGSYSNAGGKLPGLYGGNPQCSGGRDTENCFSTRYMWREDGHGELYMYFPQSNYHQNDVSCTYPFVMPMKNRDHQRR